MIDFVYYIAFYVIIVNKNVPNLAPLNTWHHVVFPGIMVCNYVTIIGLLLHSVERLNDIKVVLLMFERITRQEAVTVVFSVSCFEKVHSLVPCIDRFVDTFRPFFSPPPPPLSDEYFLSFSFVSFFSSFISAYYLFASFPLCISPSSPAILFFFSV